MTDDKDPTAEKTNRKTTNMLKLGYKALASYKFARPLCWNLSHPDLWAVRMPIKADEVNEILIAVFEECFMYSPVILDYLISVSVKQKIIEPDYENSEGTVVELAQQGFIQYLREIYEELTENFMIEKDEDDTYKNVGDIFKLGFVVANFYIGIIIVWIDIVQKFVESVNNAEYDKKKGVEIRINFNLEEKFKHISTIMKSLMVHYCQSITSSAIRRYLFLNMKDRLNDHHMKLYNKPIDEDDENGSGSIH